MSEDPAERDPADGLERLVDGMERGLGFACAFAAAFTLALAVGLMLEIGGGSEHLGGRLLVAIVACAALGGIDTAATRLARRRRPLLAPDPPWYRRFVVWSAMGCLGAWVLLLALAWYL